MRAVLDSNIFIFALQGEEEVFSDILRLAGVTFTCAIPHMVLAEVFKRLKASNGKDFASLAAQVIQSLPIERVADELIPQELIYKYQKRGAKRGDDVIAAFADWIKADYLVSENRDFLQEIETDFKTIRAKEFIRLITRGKK